jgi:hypothetical protein
MNLMFPSNVTDLNKRRHEETKSLILKTIEMLDKEDVWDNIAWTEI